METMEDGHVKQIFKLLLDVKPNSPESAARYELRREIYRAYLSATCGELYSNGDTASLSRDADIAAIKRYRDQVG